MGSRLYGIIAKEFIQLWRDGLALTLALFMPVAMLFIFGWRSRWRASARRARWRR